MAAGDVSYAKARVLVACLTEANVDELIGIAESTPASRLGAAIAAWSQRNDDPDVISRRQHEARSTSWRTEPDGMIVVTHRFTPEVGGAYCAAIDAQVIATNAPAGASLAQQRADATANLVTSGGGGTVTAEVIVHVREDGNTLTDGTPLSDHAVTRHAPRRVHLTAHPRHATPTHRCQPPKTLPHPTPNPGDRRTTTPMRPARLHRPTLPPTRPHPALPPRRPDHHHNLQRLCGPHNRAKEHTGKT